MDQPTAVFSVGSRLLALNRHGLLAEILKTLDPDITDSELSVLNSKGLANADIKLTDFIVALDLPVSLVTAAGRPADTDNIYQVKQSKSLNVTKKVMEER